MSSHKITHWLEIPVDIYFEFQPEERPTQTYPGCKPLIEVEDVFYQDSKQIAHGGFRSYLMDKYGDQILEACWDYLKGLEDK